MIILELKKVFYILLMIFHRQSLKQVEQAIGKVENKLVKLNVVKDPTLIGGIKVEVNNRVFDGTIKNKVSLLKKELLRK